MNNYIGSRKQVDEYIGNRLVVAGYQGSRKYFDAFNTVSGTPPLVFNSHVQQVLRNYAVYGTSEGAGVETESGEPAGYKLPLTVTSGAQSQDVPIYIGSTKLGAEEYVDFGEQKVYKRTENDFPYAKEGAFTFGAGYIISDGKGKLTVPLTSANVMSELIPLNRPYKIPQSIGDGGEYAFYLGNNAEERDLSLVFYDKEREKIDDWKCLSKWRINTNYVGMAGKTIAYIRIGGVSQGNTEITPMFSKNANLASYIPYIQATDPPIPLPEILTYQGENTLSSTETLGECSVTGRINV